MCLEQWALCAQNPPRASSMLAAGEIITLATTRGSPVLLDLGFLLGTVEYTSSLKGVAVGMAETM